MKMTKKKTALLAAFAVSLIALAGIGYAATYHSVTVNDSNDANGEYILVTQNGSYSGAFDAVNANSMEIGTYTDKNHVTNAPVYVLTKTDVQNVATITKNAHTYKAVPIGTGTIVLHFAPSQGLTGDLSYTIAASASDLSQDPTYFAGTSGWTYFLKYSWNNGTTNKVDYAIWDAQSHAWGDMDIDTLDGDVTVSLMIGSEQVFGDIVTDTVVPSYTGLPASTTKPVDATDKLFDDIKVIFDITYTSA